MERTFINILKEEQLHRRKGGIYHKLQIDFAYNSNHMEGSRLSHDQTQYIYETKTIHTIGTEANRVDDIIETVNHFRCFDHIIRTIDEPLTSNYIKHLHQVLKSGTMGSDLPEAVIGDYKKMPNYVGSITTTHPKNVEKEIKQLLDSYEKQTNKSFDEILDFHAAYEKIHPFYDGNGRTGRLIMFKECLRNNIIPFIITDDYKMYYIRGLKEWQTGGEKGYLRDTCLLMQDQMSDVMKYFEIQDVRDENDNEKSRPLPNLQDENNGLGE